MIFKWFFYSTTIRITLMPKRKTLYILFIGKKKMAFDNMYNIVIITIIGI